MKGRRLIERILPRRVVHPVDDEAHQQAIAASSLVRAQARQFQLDVEVYQRGLEARRQPKPEPRPGAQ